jgi:hypothetical protein
MNGRQLASTVMPHIMMIGKKMAARNAANLDRKAANLDRKAGQKIAI